MILFFIKKKENFDYVFPRYHEDTDWVSDYPDVNFYIYNRSKPIVNYINLPNNGRDCHSILYHIINNYNNLGEVTVFGAYNSQDERRFNKVKRTIELVRQTNNTVFICEDTINYDFSITNYTSSYGKNKEREEEKDRDMILSDIRPYGEWFNRKFPNFPVTWVCYSCIFAVHRNHIIQHPLNYYEDLIKGLENVNTELCHYMERAFTAVFWPYPTDCIFYT